MNKVIISLVGFENSGKTFVLNQVINVLIQCTEVTKVIRLRDLKDKTFLIYINQSLVLITTLGDHNQYLKKEIELAFLEAELPINVIVYAQRSNAKNQNFPIIDDYIKYMNYSLVYSTKQYQVNTYKKTVFHEGESRNVDFLSKTVIDNDSIKTREIVDEILKYI